jgi:hypothetical protein
MWALRLSGLLEPHFLRKFRLNLDIPGVVPCCSARHVGASASSRDYRVSYSDMIEYSQHLVCTFLWNAAVIRTVAN